MQMVDGFERRIPRFPSVLTLPVLPQVLFEDVLDAEEDVAEAARNRPLHVGALGAPDGLKALEGLALVFKPEE